jgi:hypothetical protein
VVKIHKYFCAYPRTQEDTKYIEREREKESRKMDRIIGIHAVMDIHWGSKAAGNPSGVKKIKYLNDFVVVQALYCNVFLMCVC